MIMRRATAARTCVCACLEDVRAMLPSRVDGWVVVCRLCSNFDVRAVVGCFFELLGHSLSISVYLTLLLPCSITTVRYLAADTDTSSVVIYN